MTRFTSDISMSLDGYVAGPEPTHVPVFVLTHHPRGPLALTGTTFTFVTEGVEQAGGEDVHVAGGAEAVRQCLRAGLIEEFQVHLAPVLRGGGRLFEALGDPPPRREIARVVASPGVTHLRYQVAA